MDTAETWRETLSPGRALAHPKTSELLSPTPFPPPASTLLCPQSALGNVRLGFPPSGLECLLLQAAFLIAPCPRQDSHPS